MPTVIGMTSSDTYPEEPPLSIGDVARLAGVTVPTVRNWERAGKITSSRTPGGQRRFAAADVRALLRPESVAS